MQYVSYAHVLSPRGYFKSHFPYRKVHFHLILEHDYQVLHITTCWHQWRPNISWSFTGLLSKFHTQAFNLQISEALDSSAHEWERPGWFILKENLTVELLWCYCEAPVLIAALAQDPLPGSRDDSHTKVRVVRFRARMVRFHWRGLGIRFKAGTSFVDSNSQFSEFAHFTIQSHFRSSVVVKTWGWIRHKTTFVTHFTSIQWHIWLKKMYKDGTWLYPSGMEWIMKSGCSIPQLSQSKIEEESCPPETSLDTL